MKRKIRTRHINHCNFRKIKYASYDIGSDIYILEIMINNKEINFLKKRFFFYICLLGQTCYEDFIRSKK